jgi:phosphoglycerate dehydrogenase-like enzyme
MNNHESATAGTVKSRSSHRSAVTDILVFYNEPSEFLEALQRDFPKIRFHTCESYAALPAAIAKVRPQVAFACKFEPRPFPRAAFVDSPGLEWLAVCFAGIDHVVPWDDDRLVVTNVSGVASEEMAQYVVAAIFGLYQRFPYFARRQAEHIWDYQLIRSATGARVGLLGLGHTGEAVAKLCRAVGLSVVATRASGAPSALVDEVYSIERMHEMLASVDVVVVCAALTPGTNNIFDENAFAAMRKGAYFINVSRGGLVKEEPLIAALKSGHLRGAVLDVTRTEPLPPMDPLWDAPNLLITPHTSSEFAGWQAKGAAMFADNLDRWLAGEELANRVYSFRGY